MLRESRVPINPPYGEDFLDFKFFPEGNKYRVSAYLGVYSGSTPRQIFVFKNLYEEEAVFKKVKEFSYRLKEENYRKLYEKEIETFPWFSDF